MNIHLSYDVYCVWIPTKLYTYADTKSRSLFSMLDDIDEKICR